MKELHPAISNSRSEERTRKGLVQAEKERWEPGLQAGQDDGTAITSIPVLALTPGASCFVLLAACCCAAASHVPDSSLFNRAAAAIADAPDIHPL